MQPKYLFCREGMLLAILVLSLDAWLCTRVAQAAPASVLQVDIQNVVFYNYDTYDYTKFAADPANTNGLTMKSFAMHIAVGDVVAINGELAKGTFLLRSDPMIVLRPNPTPGQAIADISRGMVDDFYIEFLLLDGTSVGSIVGFGTWGGTAPPGAPLAATTCNYAITGGAGAFLGLRGQASLATSGFPGAPTASIAEDPAHRRTHPGGSGRLILHVLPMSTPEVVLTAAGPAVVHSSDFALVSSAKPAKPGEILSLFATDLGPTKPGVDPGQPFPTNPQQLVSSPVKVLVNGTPAEVLYAGGYPGSTNGYQVNFRLPAGMTPGMSSIRITSAWIAGQEAKIAVQ